MTASRTVGANPPARPVADAVRRRLAQVVTAAFGLVLPDDRLPLIDRAVAAAAPPMGPAPTAEELIAWLVTDPGQPAIARFIAELTIGETYFFRTPHHFTALREHIIPTLASRRDGPSQLTAWSAACATGEEPYSLAITLLDELPPGWRFSVVGSDVDVHAVEHAIAARYRPRSFLHTPAHVLERHFSPPDRGGLRAVTARATEPVRFVRANILDGPPPGGPFDLVMCRNLLIHLSPSARRRAVEVLTDAVAPGGCLIVAPAEMAAESFPRFARWAGAADAALRKEGTGPHQAGVLCPPVARPGRAALRSLRTGPPLRSPQRLTAAMETRRAPDDGRPLAAYVGALEAARHGPPIQAVDAARAVVAAAPLAAAAHHLLGTALLEASRGEDAIASFRQCTTIAPAWPVGHLALAVACAAAGNRARALPAARAALRLVQDQPDGAALPSPEGWEPTPATAGWVRRHAGFLVATWAGATR